MMIRRAVALAVTGAVVAALAPYGLPAGAVGETAPRAVGTTADHDVVVPKPGTHTWRTKDALVPVVTGPRDELSFGIDTRLYVPDNASRRTPQPAILMTHGFGGSKDMTEVLTTARFFAAHGYVVLTYSSAGFGASGGCVSLQSADYDVKSARQLIDKVLEPRPDVLRDGRGVVVGAIGGSYGAGYQLPLAAVDERIRTVVAGRTWNNLRYSLDPNNLAVPGDATGLAHPPMQGVFKQQWTSLLYLLGNTQPLMGKGGCAAAKLAAGDPADVPGAATCPGFHATLCDIFNSLTTTGDIDAAAMKVLARASAATYLHEVRIPVLLVQGQSDTIFNLNDATSTFTALQRRRVPVGMIWNDGGHGGYLSKPGECDAYDNLDRTVAEMSRCYLPLRSLGWMDHWLRGTKTGRGPLFTYYRDWSRRVGTGPNDEQYGASGYYPARTSTAFDLSSSGSLVRRGRKVGAEPVTFSNPLGGLPAAYSETSQFSGPGATPHLAAEPTDVPGQFAAFTSTPFARPFVSVGIPSASLRISGSNGRDTVFFAKVFDVAPDGRATLVRRLITPVRVPAGHTGPVDVRLLGFAHRFAAGHRVRLVLCSTDATSYNAKLPDTLTVRTGRASTFVLPGTMDPARP